MQDIKILRTIIFSFITNSSAKFYMSMFISLVKTKTKFKTSRPS